MNRVLRPNESYRVIGSTKCHRIQQLKCTVLLLILYHVIPGSTKMDGKILILNVN